ncbi:hypothetical protein Lser_V15G32607 [Lactuca serriola]
MSYGYLSGKSKPTSNDDEERFSIDAHIKSWFYSTCDPSLLQIICSDDCSAKDLWDKLHEFFRNNKMFEMLQLQDQFRNTKKGSNFITEFCHTLKNLADDLKDVDSPITDIELVMQNLCQFPPSYHNIVDVITNTKSFPSFFEAKNMLLIHESREASSNSLLDSNVTQNSALFSSSNNSGRSKKRWSKNRNTQRNSTKPRSHVGQTDLQQNFAGFLGHAPIPAYGPGPTASMQ